MAKNICMYLLAKRDFPQNAFAIKYKQNGQWLGQSWQEYIANIELVAGGFKKLGMARAQNIAILANTRYEWPMCDLAIMSLGCVTVPIYPSSTTEEMQFILQNAEVSVLVLEDSVQWEKWKQIKNSCSSVKHVFLMDTKGISEKVDTLADLMEKGKVAQKEDRQFFTKSIESIKMTDLATIHYTSGTTGVPKGVSLTHTQIFSEVSDVFSEIGMIKDDMTLSFLPYSHVLGHVEHWGSIYLGYTLAFAENIDKIRDNLREVSPTVIVAVPRIFEKIYNGVLSQSEINPAKKKIFQWALKVGSQVSKIKRQKQQVPLALFAQYLVATKLVFSKLQQGLGGKLRFAVCGGAPLSAQIAEFFHAAGILILEGYGLTETSAAVTVNKPHDYEFGSVGKALADVKIKIADDGEILVKSDKVMKEYYKNPEATKEVMHDGWFATGDIGELTDRGFLRITDRKKDLIKTAGGKYVAPQKLENILKLNKFISNVLIHGDQKKYIVCLLTLHPDEVKKYASQQQISYTNYADLVKSPEIQQLIRGVVANANSQLASYESIKNFEILPNDFTIESGELTPSMKVKRKLCDKKYKEIIDSLY